MKWEPADIIRFTALIGGFLLCGLGALLMWLGVGAEGAVDIRSSLLSGTIKTGSAGLFTLFFGFGIIVFVLLSLTVKSANTHLTQVQRKSRTKHIAQAFVATFIAFVAFAALAGTYGASFAPVAAFLGILLFGIGATYVVQLDYE